MPESFREDRIKARVAGRRDADEVFGVLSWPDGFGADYADALCEHLRDKLPKRAQPAPKRPEPLNRLAAEEMPFGQYAGTRFDNVPDDYLDWLCRSQEEFLAKLRAYLTHPDRVRTVDHEDDDDA